MTWDDTRRQFQREVAKHGAAKVAQKIPVHVSTVYRLMKGETSPHQIVKVAVERFVKDSSKGEK